MAMPGGSDYEDAIQTPKFAFSNPALQRCTAELGTWGTPKPYSGGFTTTFHLQDGGQSWAVRCFTRQIADLAQRYKAITAFIKQHKLPYFIDTEYIEDGIRVRGVFYPLIKMKWVQGQNLNEYIADIHADKAAVEQLMQDFMQMTTAFAAYQVAHGDLQHGNIMMSGGQLYVIDYDGMYLPSLKGMTENERGNPDYQHPLRAYSNFDQNLDRFSSISIYLALLALSHRPILWYQYDNQDNILFKAADFADPDASKLFADLKKIQPIIQQVEDFAKVCKAPFELIPTLEDFLLHRNIPTSIAPKPQAQVVRSPFTIVDGHDRYALYGALGRRVEVLGRVNRITSSTWRGQPSALLHIHKTNAEERTLYIVIPPHLLHIRQQYERYAGKYVSIRGIPKLYRNNIRIELENSHQLRLLDYEDYILQLSDHQTTRQPETVSRNWWEDHVVLIPPAQPITPSISPPLSQPQQPAQAPKPALKPKPSPVKKTKPWWKFW